MLCNRTPRDRNAIIMIAPQIYEHLDFLPFDGVVCILLQLNGEKVPTAKFAWMLNSFDRYMDNFRWKKCFTKYKRVQLDKVTELTTIDLHFVQYALILIFPVHSKTFQLFEKCFH